MAKDEIDSTSDRCEDAKEEIEQVTPAVVHPVQWHSSSALSATTVGLDLLAEHSESMHSVAPTSRASCDGGRGVQHAFSLADLARASLADRGRRNGRRRTESPPAWELESRPECPLRRWGASMIARTEHRVRGSARHAPRGVHEIGSSDRGRSLADLRRSGCH